MKGTRRKRCIQNERTTYKEIEEAGFWGYNTGKYVDRIRPLSDVISMWLGS